MLTIEEYISQMKKKNNLDEFNFKKHAENMAAVIGYVTSYFNNYLDPEAYDYENIKTDQTIQKIMPEIQNDFPRSQEFIIEYYKKLKTRIDKTLKKWLETLQYEDLFCCHDDYDQAVAKFCSSAKMRNTGIEQYKDELIILAEEIKKTMTEKPSFKDYKFMDNMLTKWVKETYREYDVNLLDFAETVTSEYYEKYVEYIHSRDTETSFYLNNYNHRYNDSPFEIDDIYDDNKHRPFIAGRKGELEMLIMYDWIFYNTNDSEYWPEYVNLCATTGRVSSIQKANKLLPVITKGVPYPGDIKSGLKYTETTNGLLKEDPCSPYIIRLGFVNDNDLIWKDQQVMNTLMANLNDTFSKYGEPYALELLSPIRSNSFKEEEFFTQYRQFEKGMKKYKSMIIALVNGPVTYKTKPDYLMTSVDEIVRIREISRDMNFRLKLVIDVSKIIGRNKNPSAFEFGDVFNHLREIRNSIVGIHLPKVMNSTYINKYFEKDDKFYLNKFDYPENSYIINELSAMFNDHQCRYFVPVDISNPDDLEDLVDDLLRGGISFCEKEG